MPLYIVLGAIEDYHIAAFQYNYIISYMTFSCVLIELNLAIKMTILIARFNLIKTHENVSLPEVSSYYNETSERERLPMGDRMGAYVPQHTILTMLSMLLGSIIVIDENKQLF